MTEIIRLRFATLLDIPVIVHQRRAMFEDMGYGTPESLDKMDTLFGLWVNERMQEGAFLTWLAVNEEERPIAGAGLWLLDWMPGPIDPAARKAYICNVYTHPDYRHRGLARQILREMMQWCRAQQISILELHASQFGRPLYEALGFAQTNEMRLILEA